MYYALFSFTFLIQIINDFGIQYHNNRTIAQHKQLLEKYLSNILVLKFCLGMLYLAVLFVIAHLTNYPTTYYPFIRLMGLYQILLSLLAYFRSNISGLGAYRADSLLSILDKLLLIPICGTLLWVEPFSSQFKIEWFIYAQLTSLTITNIIAFFIVRKRVKKIKLRFNPPFLIHLLKRSAPFALTVFLMTLYTRIDIVMIERLLPDGKIQSGIYASAYRLLDVANTIGLLAAGLLIPMFAKLISDFGFSDMMPNNSTSENPTLRQLENARNEQEKQHVSKSEIESLLHLSLKLVVGIATIVAVTVCFHSNEIMHLLYKEATPYSATVLRNLILSFVSVSGIYIYGALMTATGKLQKLNRVFLLAIALNVVLNLILIPPYKALGASIATCCTQLLVVVAHILIARKTLNLQHTLQPILQLSLFASLMLASSYATHHYLPALNWILAASIAAVAPVLVVIGYWCCRRQRQRQLSKVAS
jgi:O-antigen/teichoic acid export membrane protein